MKGKKNWPPMRNYRNLQFVAFVISLPKNNVIFQFFKNVSPIALFSSDTTLAQVFNAHLNVH